MGLRRGENFWFRQRAVFASPLSAFFIPYCDPEMWAEGPLKVIKVVSYLADFPGFEFLSALNSNYSQKWCAVF